MNNAIRCEQLAKSFHDGELHVDVLNDLSLTVPPGEMLAIIGSSGSGKSTLLHLLGGLDKPTAGQVFVADNELSSLSEKQKGDLRNQYLGFVYQFHHLLPEFTALENVAMPLLIRGIKPKIALDKAKTMIERVGLVKRVKHRVGELSGGERQRIAIARALVTEPKCVLADEPTGNLDHETAQQIFDLMCQLNRSMNTSFVVVTHNEDLAAKLNRVLVLKNGSLQEKA
ncbi:MAG: lipoprotein-releasing ABC transporter ATP-binding protein LolD [Coxiellaceae bacterium]|nr:lipoprotein-releasing ABC transporter ATP-binding protein LolD [Coxiellaceae bacterium]